MDNKKISYQNIVSVENLLAAWHEFRKGKRNKKDIQEFQLHLMDNILDLHDELVCKTYEHGGYEEFHISDPKPRVIHKANVRDRVLHHAVYRILYPYADRKFIFDSYSCRNGKGHHRAIKRFQKFVRKVSENYTKKCWVLQCDIKKFFANIDHNVLNTEIEKYTDDEDIKWLLRRIIGSFQTSDNVGLPLGNLASQILVNIYANKLDQYVKHILHTKCYIRYADDFVFLNNDKKHLELVLQKIQEFLKNELHLSLHTGKTHITPISSGVDFLGWVHFPNHRVLRIVTKRKIMRNISKNYSEEMLQSYLGLFSWGNAWKLVERIVNFNIEAV